MKTHKVVPVNTAEPVSISTEHMDIDLNVRIQVRHSLILLAKFVYYLLVLYTSLIKPSLTILLSITAASHPTPQQPPPTSPCLNMPNPETNIA
jgi:hypothetical protein